MLGGMFSGHTECAGEVIERNGQKLKLFYGMSSETAMKKHSGGVAVYRYVGVGWGVGTAPQTVPPGFPEVPGSQSREHQAPVWQQQ